MASRNLIALQSGRISEDQFNSMAVYKYTQYDNGEDLDYNHTDYSQWGLYKATPAFRYYPVANTYEDIVAEIDDGTGGEVDTDSIHTDIINHIENKFLDDSIRITPSGWFWLQSGITGGDFLQLENLISEVYSLPGKVSVYDWYEN